jgi:hypothetical protein
MTSHRKTKSGTAGASRERAVGKLLSARDVGRRRHARHAAAVSGGSILWWIRSRDSTRACKIRLREGRFRRDGACWSDKYTSMEVSKVVSSPEASKTKTGWLRRRPPSLPQPLSQAWSYSWTLDGIAGRLTNQRWWDVRDLRKCQPMRSMPVLRPATCAPRTSISSSILSGAASRGAIAANNLSAVSAAPVPRQMLDSHWDPRPRLLAWFMDLPHLLQPIAPRLQDFKEVHERANATNQTLGQLRNHCLWQNHPQQTNEASPGNHGS